MLRVCLSKWEIIEDLSYDYPKIRDLKIEIQQRWEQADLNDSHRAAIRFNLVEDKTQKETGRLMDTGTRWVARLVDQALERMARVTFS